MINPLKVAKTASLHHTCFTLRELTKKGKFMDILRIILSILLPPLGVFLQVGIGVQFWINIVLTLFGYIPGIVHAVYIIATR